jgi:hypothetical protein
MFEIEAKKLQKKHILKVINHVEDHQSPCCIHWMQHRDVTFADQSLTHPLLALPTTKAL